MVEVVCCQVWFAFSDEGDFRRLQCPRLLEIAFRSWFRSRFVSSLCENRRRRSGSNPRMEPVSAWRAPARGLCNFNRRQGKFSPCVGKTKPSCGNFNPCRTKFGVRCAKLCPNCANFSPCHANFKIQNFKKFCQNKLSIIIQQPSTLSLKLQPKRSWQFLGMAAFLGSDDTPFKTAVGTRLAKM